MPKRTTRQEANLGQEGRITKKKERKLKRRVAGEIPKSRGDSYTKAIAIPIPIPIPIPSEEEEQVKDGEKSSPVRFGYGGKRDAKEMIEKEVNVKKQNNEKNHGKLGLSSEKMGEEQGKDGEKSSPVRFGHGALPPRLRPPPETSDPLSDDSSDSESTESEEQGKDGEKSSPLRFMHGALPARLHPPLEPPGPMFDDPAEMEDAVRLSEYLFSLPPRPKKRVICVGTDDESEEKKNARREFENWATEHDKAISYKRQGGLERKFTIFWENMKRVDALNEERHPDCQLEYNHQMDRMGGWCFDFCKY